MSADADAVLGLAFIAVPAKVAVKAVDEFVDALVLVVAVVVELLFEPAEEALGGVIGATALGAHESGQSVVFADANPSGQR